jgi:hypothetical protein
MYTEEYRFFTSDSNPLKALRMMISAAVPMRMAATLTEEMMLMALVDFLALKYLQANVKIMEETMRV